jgi:hypothetical protein
MRAMLNPQIEHRTANTNTTNLNFMIFSLQTNVQAKRIAIICLAS